MEEIGLRGGEDGDWELEPEADAVEDGEESEPEEHGVEFAAEERDGQREKTEGGECGSEEEIEPVVAKDLENLLCGPLWVGFAHRSE
jgi:hypothetical protein